MSEFHSPEMLQALNDTVDHLSAHCFAISRGLYDRRLSRETTGEICSEYLAEIGRWVDYRDTGVAPEGMSVRALQVRAWNIAHPDREFPTT